MNHPSDGVEYLVRALAALVLGTLKRWRGRYGRHSQDRHHGRHMRRGDQDHSDPTDQA